MARKFVRGFPAKEATVPNKPDLKYLEFLYIAAVQAILCAAALYHVAKERSGPLRGGVETVERSVKSVVNPVYQRYQEVPVCLLLLADRKVDSALGAVEHHVPPTVKTVSAHVYAALCALTAALCDFLNDARASGPSAALKATGGRYKPVAAELCKDYGPVAEHYAVATWQFLNGLPIFPQAAHLVIPTAAHWAEKYNHAVESGSARGIAFVQYLPEVPVEKVAKVFSGNNTQREVPDETQPEAKAAQAASPEPEAKAVPTE